MLVRKLHDSWNPIEYPNLLVGDVCEITYPDELIRQGLVEKVIGSNVVTEVVVEDKVEDKVAEPIEEPKKRAKKVTK